MDCNFRAHWVIIYCMFLKNEQIEFVEYLLPLSCQIWQKKSSADKNDKDAASGILSKSFHWFYFFMSKTWKPNVIFFLLNKSCYRRYVNYLTGLLTVKISFFLLILFPRIIGLILKEHLSTSVSNQLPLPWGPAVVLTNQLLMCELPVTMRKDEWNIHNICTGTLEKVFHTFGEKIL